MYVQDKRKTPHNVGLILDLLHIAVGSLVVVCAVLAFLNPEGNQILFPVIFLLGALLYGANGWHRYKAGGRDKKKMAGAVLLGGIAAALLLVAAISAVSIWR